MRALIPYQGGVAEVQVFRNGNNVRAIGMAHLTTPQGNKIEAAVDVRTTVAGYLELRETLIRRIGTLAYTRLKGRFGVDDDIMKAPPLPSNQNAQPRLLRRSS